MATVGSMSTADPLQQLYAMGMMQSYAPYMNQTVQGLGNMGDNPINTYKGPADWNQYVKQQYTDPITYDMRTKLANLGHTKEFFSSGYQNRRADTMNSANAQMNSLIGNDMMTQRQNNISGMEQGLQRQQKALQQFNSIMGAPLAYQGQENTVSARSLFDEIGSLWN